jgi:hypothetical protein
VLSKILDTDVNILLAVHRENKKHIQIICGTDNRPRHIPGEDNKTAQRAVMGHRYSWKISCCPLPHALPWN